MGLTHWKGLGNKWWEADRIHNPSAIPLTALRAFLAEFREIPHLWEHHETASCTLWERHWPKDLADGGGKESTCTALPSSLLPAVRHQGAEEKGPFPAQISPSPHQHSSCSDACTTCTTKSPRPGLSSSSLSAKAPQRRAVIYKELTPRHLAILILQLLIKQEDRSPLGTAGVRKSGILWPLKGAHSACFCHLPGLLLCIYSNKSFN